MIKTKKGHLRIKGNSVEVKADISTIIYHLYYEILPENMTPEEAKEFIMSAVERGFKTPEQLEAEMKEQLGNILGKIAESMKGQGEE